jgi:putative tryptophan/tyrosine transport system substrate-binding protein
VFAQVPDPVGAGYVDSLSRPGGNATGFTGFEYGISAKWLELVKEMVPSVTRVAVIRDSAIASGIGQWAAIQAVAPGLRIELRPIGVGEPGEMDRALAIFAREPNGGLIVTASGRSMIQRNLIIALAAQHKLPAVYWLRSMVADGGLTSYGPDNNHLYRSVAGYVDRILRGETPADLPVQAPTKYELAINLKTARALGLEVPPTLLARADEVIE